MAQTPPQNRREYECGICTRLKTSTSVPFRQVSIDDWHSEIAKCPDNVAAWIKSYPQHSAVHGWVVYVSYGESAVGLTAHTIVRDENGDLFDITPLEDESIRRGMTFVPHQGDPASFAALREGAGISFTCPPGLTDNITTSFPGSTQNRFNDIEHW